MKNGGCEQLCVDGYDGQFHCRCRDGYRLGTDGKSCQGVCSRKRNEPLSIPLIQNGTNDLFVENWH